MATTKMSRVNTEKISMKELLEKIKHEMVDLTSLKFNTFVGVGIDDDTNAHKVTLELVERNAIPDSMDLLGIYEVIVNDSGDIQTFRRIGMRKRSDAVTSEEY